MGQTLSEPVTDKHPDRGKDDRLMFGLSSMQGYRPTMEDRHTALLKLSDSSAGFFGVFDGHGGVEAAKYTSENLHIKIRESEFFQKQEYEKALKNGYIELDKGYKEIDHDSSGCTAVSALITPDLKSLFVANAGDSRAVISVKGKHKALSFDHKPTNEIERKRIVEAGGFVEFGRVNGNLAMSRAIGDFDYKQGEVAAEDQIVTCNPDIIQHNITAEDEFIVLACDGIWDCLENSEVINYVVQKVVEKRAPLEEICNMAMDHCLDIAKDNSQGVGFDNMSMIIVAFLHGKSEDEWYDWMKGRHGRKLKQVDIANNPSKNVPGKGVSKEKPEGEQ